MKVTMHSDLVAGEYYLIKSKGRELVAKHVKTRGNDEDYPTFEVGMLHSDPYQVSVPRIDVVSRLVPDAK